MSGGWRITNEEVAADLRRIRRRARESRTDEAWDAVAIYVRECRRLEIPEREWLLD